MDVSCILFYFIIATALGLVSWPVMCTVLPRGKKVHLWQISFWSFNFLILENLIVNVYFVFVWVLLIKNCYLSRNSLHRKNQCKYSLSVIVGFTFFFFNLFIYWLIDWLIDWFVLGLRFCARAFSSCGKRGPLFIAVRGPLTVVASLVAEHRLQTCRLSSCGSRA